MLAYLRTLCKTDKECEHAEARICSVRPRPIWSPSRCCDPCLPRTYSSLNCCEPCCPPNCLKVYCSTPECNPCYDLSSCNLSCICKHPCDLPCNSPCNPPCNPTCNPLCTYCFRCNDCCLYSPDIDPWCTYVPPIWPEDCCPSPSCCVPRPSSLCQSCTTPCSPMLCREISSFPKSCSWDPCCLTPSEPSITCYKISATPRDNFSCPTRRPRSPRRTPQDASKAVAIQNKNFYKWCPPHLSRT